MSLAEPASRTPASAFHPGRFKLALFVLAAWGIAAAAMIFSAPGVKDFMSADDLMRLVEVRDWIAGQNWFDVTQYRLDPPDGSSMHWSRIIDLPIALGILLLSPFISSATAEIVTSAVWPMFLLIPSLALSGLLAKRLANAAAFFPAVLLAAVSAPFLIHYRPGALDHHGIQLLLVLATLYGVTDRGDARVIPALGGFAAAVSLAIGFEMIPVLACILAAVGLRWVIEGKETAPLTSSFGVAFGAGTAILLMLTVSPSAWATVRCDYISPPIVVAAGLSGGMLALLATTGARLVSPYARFAAASIAGVAAIAGVCIPFRACLGNPFGMIDPRVTAIWLDHVAETQNALEVAWNFPNEWLTFYAAPVLALLLGCAAMRKLSTQQRPIFIAPLFALCAFDAVALWELRGSAGANLIAHPILAASLVLLFQVRSSLLANRAALLSFLLVSNPVFTLAGDCIGGIVSWLNPGRIKATDNSPLFCRRLADMDRLGALEPGLVVSYIDIGPSILAATKHSVLAAPYHRNVRGNTAAYDILMGDDATARRTLAERKARYVAICPGAPERGHMKNFAPNGLGERLARGEVPNYLETIPGEPAEPLKLYRVR